MQEWYPELDRSCVPSVKSITCVSLCVLNIAINIIAITLLDTSTPAKMWWKWSSNTYDVLITRRLVTHHIHVHRTFLSHLNTPFCAMNVLLLIQTEHEEKVYAKFAKFLVCYVLSSNPDLFIRQHSKSGIYPVLRIKLGILFFFMR